MKEIRFYRASEKPYGVFGNLYRRPISFEGQIYPTPSTRIRRVNHASWR
jgi:hypothetical protein